MRKEITHQQESEFSADLLESFTQVFLSRTDCYPVQKPDGSYRSLPHPLLPGIVSAHLRGLITIGAYALDKRSKAKWLCLDADTDDTWMQLRAMSAELDESAIPTCLERSRRGGHVWFFFETPHSGEDTRRFARQILSQHDIADVEIYPKQDRLQTGPGSLVRLPLGVHRLTGQMYPFVTLDDQPIGSTIREQAEILAKPTRVPTAFVKQILKQVPDEPRILPTRSFIKRDSPNYGKTPSERIKNRIPVANFVSQYVDLDGSGRGLCPFHDDHVNSFSVNAERNYWHCFAGCGGGSIIDFWMKWRELDGRDGSFTATVSDLAKLLLK